VLCWGAFPQSAIRRSSSSLERACSTEFQKWK